MYAVFWYVIFRTRHPNVWVCLDVVPHITRNTTFFSIFSKYDCAKDDSSYIILTGLHQVWSLICRCFDWRSVLLVKLPNDSVVLDEHGDSSHFFYQAKPWGRLSTEINTKIEPTHYPFLYPCNSHLVNLLLICSIQYNLQKWDLTPYSLCFATGNQWWDSLHHFQGNWIFVVFLCMQHNIHNNNGIQTQTCRTFHVTMAQHIFNIEYMVCNWSRWQICPKR